MRDYLRHQSPFQMQALSKKSSRCSTYHYWYHDTTVSTRVYTTVFNSVVGQSKLGEYLDFGSNATSFGSFSPTSVSDSFYTDEPFHIKGEWCDPTSDRISMSQCVTTEFGWAWGRYFQFLFFSIFYFWFPFWLWKRERLVLSTPSY